MKKLNDSSTTPFYSPWLDTHQAALYLGTNPVTMRVWRCEGKGPEFHVVNRKLIRYHKDSLDTFVRGGRPAPKPAA